ncbi:MAG: class I SAM-dependent methyltransferase, partial [Candidatus Omnitrophica bacterium]|nr:class I SAM-dependent methyltransferase [Candidatus Omnitrophota bacterium]
ETRIIPEETSAKFLAQHLKPYEFVSGLIKGKRVLEVGCGDGYGTSYLSGFASQAVGVDYDQASIGLAKTKYRAKNLDFSCMDATDLSFEDDSFDAVCSFQVIEHIPEELLPKYLKEIKRVLKKDGVFYLTTLNLAHVMKSPLTYKKHPAHCKEFRLVELKELLSGEFKIIEVYGLQLTLKHRLFQRLKKIGIESKAFYSRITTRDFKFTQEDPQKASDFLIVMGK